MQIDLTEKLDDASQYVFRWWFDPLQWVEDMFGDNIRARSGLSTRTGLSEQQEDAFCEIGKVVEAKFLRNVRKEPLKGEQLEYAKKVGLSIMSGTGTGKDFFAALAMTWFLSVFSDAKGAAMANNKPQLRAVLWAEVAKVMDMSLKSDPSSPSSLPILRQMLDWGAERIGNKAGNGEDWFFEAVTIGMKKGGDSTQTTSLAGRHADHMMFIMDEAAGIPDPAFEPLIGTLTGPINFMLVIFNPVKRTGFAIDSQRDDRFISKRWNSEDSPLVSRDHIESLECYGRDSSIFRVRVLGLPPLADSDTLINYERVYDAVDRPIEVTDQEALVIGVDVGAGGDRSIILVRRGMKVLEIVKKNTDDTMELVGWIASYYEDYKADVCFVDNIGVGVGVYNRLKELKKYRVVAADVRKSSKSEQFERKRDEIYWRLRGFFEEGVISIPNDVDLIDQATTIGVKPLSNGSMKVESKREIRSQGRPSPDELDALALSFYKPDFIYRKKGEEDDYGSEQAMKVSLKNVFLR